MNAILEKLKYSGLPMRLTKLPTKKPARKNREFVLATRLLEYKKHLSVNEVGGTYSELSEPATEIAEVQNPTQLSSNITDVGIQLEGTPNSNHRVQNEEPQFTDDDAYCSDDQLDKSLESIWTKRNIVESNTVAP
ncbi:hypothetical protein M9H77_33404 [Catharanthus roseus]|uniref:Uncharacterized protein n=1 Tax=Catharanthus roseus TaxID=4058 RepID=A0ACB9ZJZ9_CATRO|nr:hypothetical protein M9H77_33404 [Catharanthus roseus]